MEIAAELGNACVAWCRHADQRARPAIELSEAQEIGREIARSESDKPEVIAAKLAYYESHAPSRAVLLVRQDSLGVAVRTRLDASRWSARELTAADDVIELPEIGPIGTVGQLYRLTPLDPAKAR